MKKGLCAYPTSTAGSSYLNLDLLYEEFQLGIGSQFVPINVEKLLESKDEKYRFMSTHGSSAEGAAEFKKPTGKCSIKTPVPDPEDPEDIDVEEVLETKRQRDAFSEIEAMRDDYDIMDDYYESINENMIDIENVDDEVFVQLYQWSTVIVKEISENRIEAMEDENSDDKRRCFSGDLLSNNKNTLYF